MSLLSDEDLLAEIEQENLVLHPYDEELVQPASVDIRIGRRFLVFDYHRYSHIDPAEEQPNLTRTVTIDEGFPFSLHTGKFVLATTLEHVKVGPGLALRIEGKSSLGRLGLLVHATAGFIDPGFQGHVTLELSNVAGLPIRIWPGMKIGQLSVFKLSSPTRHPYGSTPGLGSHYQGQVGPTPSRAHEGFKTWPAP